MTWVGVLVMLVGCLPREEKFPEYVAEAFCEWGQRCFGESSFSDSDMAECVSDLESDVRTGFVECSGYNAKYADRCLTGIESAACETDAIPEVCDRVYAYCP